MSVHKTIVVNSRYHCTATEMRVLVRACPAPDLGYSHPSDLAWEWVCLTVYINVLCICIQLPASFQSSSIISGSRGPFQSWQTVDVRILTSPAMLWVCLLTSDRVLQYRMLSVTKRDVEKIKRRIRGVRWVCFCKISSLNCLTNFKASGSSETV